MSPCGLVVDTDLCCVVLFRILKYGAITYKAGIWTYTTAKT